MAHVNHFQRLGVDLLTNILQRLDFLQLRVFRATCSSFLTLAMSDEFATAYMPSHEVWDFTHTQRQDDMHDNWLTVRRGSDGISVTFTLDFDEFNLEEDGGIALIRTFGSLFVFTAMSTGFKVFNLWTMSSRVIQYPLAAQMDLLILDGGLRMIHDPLSPLHYILAFYNHVIMENAPHFHFFSFQSRVGDLVYPEMLFSQEVDELTEADLFHPLWMMTRDLDVDQLAYHSIRNGMPVHLLQPMILLDDLCEAFQPPVIDYGVQLAVSRQGVFCSEGYVVVIDLEGAQVQGFDYGIIRRLTLCSVVAALGVDEAHLISVAPDDRIPSDFALFSGHRLTVVQGVVYLSFHCMSIQGLWDIVVLQYVIQTQLWSIRRFPRPAQNAFVGDTFSASPWVITPFV